MERKLDAKEMAHMVEARYIQWAPSELAQKVHKDETTVSRYKNEVRKVCALLEALGLKIVDAEQVVTTKERIESLEYFAGEYFASKRNGDSL